jgi:hypothetical protein
MDTVVKNLQTNRKEEKKMSEYDPHNNPCVNCFRETGACLLTLGQCPDKRKRELKEVEMEALWKELVPEKVKINFDAIETD